MKVVIAMGLLFAGVAGAQVRDEGARYVVAPAEVVEGREASSVLIRYDLSKVPLETTLNSVIWYKGTASGSGSNPSFSIWAIENDWKKGPKKIERISETIIYQNTDGPIPFPVSKYIRGHLKDGMVSFLIESRSTPGFSQQVGFSDQPWLVIAKAQEPLYDLSALLRPLWKGSRIENETLLPTAYGGKPAEADFAFVPSKITSVKNYALDRTYEEGKDYVLKGRTLCLAKNSSIPFFNYAELYHNNPEAKTGVMPTVDGGYMAFSESSLFNDKQLAVTYERSNPWKGPVPKPAKKLLPKSFRILEAGKPLKLVVFGDSISTGASASGKMSQPPYMPGWPDLVAGELARNYGSDIDFINSSLGGMLSNWGRDTVDGLVSFEKPDLVVIGFGMNDAGIPFSAEQYTENTRAMLESIRKQNSDAEFILLMSFQPNSKWRSLEPMPDYLEALEKMEGPGIAVADVWSIHGYLLEHKTYWDMTGNHVNHPNDFMARIYAQVILARLGVK